MSPATPGRKPKVLIAEDEKPLARALALKLGAEGIDTDVVHDGDAVKQKLASTAYDLILMDLMMPKHDGFAVLEEMKQKGNTTPIVIMSNLSQDTDRNRAAIAGAAHYFVKADIKLADVVAYIKKNVHL
jgi:DNA-binding response OmpR family regulator